MIRMFVLILALSFAKVSMAWTWHDLWQTRDQQAQALMSKKQFKEAAEHFKSPEWQAAALYRAGRYQAAEKLYRKQTSENAYYNQGNALALQGQYQAAIAAYDKALAINPQHEDALFNRQLLKDVLKKKQQQQEDKKEGDQKKPSEQQQQDEKSQQDKKNQQEQSATQASHQEQQAEQQQDHKQQGNEQQVKPSKQGDKGEPKPKAAEKANGKEAQARKNSKEDDPWLRLIPDEPGGLLREKFLRDYLQRHQGQSE